MYPIGCKKMPPIIVIFGGKKVILGELNDLLRAVHILVVYVERKGDFYGNRY